ncbi:MAG TPA: hypothetical protein VMV94_11375 [Phycisphaerae bacterium]|nr:hypothetical protein [Phycisphaerae bacterium]
MRAFTLRACAVLGFALVHANLASAVPGDMNCDGHVYLDDVGPFVAALVNPAGYPYSCIENADLSGDGVADGMDIEPFVDILLAPPSGSCCHADGSCTVTLAADCTGLWTMFRECEPNPCDQPTGSCCQPNGTCTVTPQACCTGTWTMFGTCSPNPCQQPTGSCCQPNGTCTVTLQANCTGTWTMFGTCTPNPCQQPTGSCCQPNGTCTVTLQANCTGTWTMFGTCTPNPCQQPTGSCCQPNGTCTVTLQANCTGTWTMFGTCSPNPCQQPTGSCCYPDYTCAVTLQANCTGTWTMFGTCTPNPCGQTIISTQLAGNSLTAYPYFEYVTAFNVNAPVQLAIDPTRFPRITGHMCNIYIVAAKTDAQWQADPTLTDVTPGGAMTTTFSGSTIQGNTVTVATANQLSASAGTGLGVGYDMVIDVNRNGILDGGDYIDGLGSEAGFYMVHDTTAAGPLAVTEIIYSGGSWLGEDTYYPTNIASMGQLPLIVISHGNGHNYQWYDHIGYHMASYGYIVMSHENNTGPGIETASTTTLTNTDYIIGHQSTIGGGVLNGHVDSHRITWIGHSRGAEGITRAYDRIIDGTYTPTYFTADDILLLSSMLPTDFLGTSSSNPHAANYHLWTASADADVDGSAGCDLCQTFHLHGRATRYAQSTIVQGAGHGDFHDGGGSSVASGPCLIGRDITHLIQKGYFLPLIKHYIEGNIPGRDFLWRQYEHFHPIGVDTSNPCVVVSNEYRNGSETGNTIIDDYQTQTSTSISSSGGAVTYNVDNLTEGLLNDNNSSFTWSTSDPFNGATQDGPSDVERGVVFDWNNTNKYYEWEVIPAFRNFSDDLYISLRGAQGTQHPYTLTPLGIKTCTLTLRDGNGVSSSISTGAYGGGFGQPYARSGGWHNEMRTIRVRLTDFLTNGSGLDLSNIVAVRLNFGPSWGTSSGRFVIDQLMLDNAAMPNTFISIGIVGGAPTTLPVGTPTVLNVDITVMGEEIVVGSEQLHYRYDAGAYQVVPMTLVSPGHYQATLPAPDCSDTPQFYVSAEGTVTGLVTAPQGAPGVVYTASVGAYAAFYTNPLDTNPGWTTETQWAFGVPTGQGGEYGEPDPTSGHTGVNVYGYNLNGDYENSLTTERKLTSTAINCSGRTHVKLSFWRWLGVEQPLYDHARVYVSNNGTTWNVIWENDATYDGGAWQYVEYDISAYADNQPTVYLRWTMGTTDSGWRYCGWNIDDIQLSAFMCD